MKFCLFIQHKNIPQTQFYGDFYIFITGNLHRYQFSLDVENFNIKFKFLPMSAETYNYKKTIPVLLVPKHLVS